MRIYEITEAIGPHNFKELELMIQGVKPAALADTDQMAKWWPAVKKYGWTAELIADAKDGYVIARDPAKAQEIKTLLTNMWRGKVPMGSKNMYYAKLGQLLGYSAIDIAHFILRTGVGPTLWDGTAKVLSQLGKVLAPVARVAGGVGTALALHSGELNSGEDEDMAKRRASWATPPTPEKPDPNTVTTVAHRLR